MKKRQFLAQGGALASGVVTSPWLSTSARANSATDTPPEHMQASVANPGDGMGAWQSRLGEHFDAISTLGRDVSLQLAEVLPQASADSGVEQFRLSFVGPRHLPLQEGLHTLHAPQGNAISLHLQPVRTANGLRYVAHFSLLS